MSRLRVKNRILVFFILFVMSDHCFWLLNTDNQKKLFEVCWVVFFVMFILVFAKTKFKDIIVTEKYMFSKEILFMLVMALYSALQSMIIHGQSFAQGIFPQRFVVFTFLFYFVITNYLNKKRGALESLRKMFLLVGYLELFFYLAQYFLFGIVQFLQLKATIRMGELRLNFAAVAIHFVVFDSINNMFQKKKIVPKDIILVVLGLFYFFQVAKIRLYVIAYIIAIIGAFILWKKAGKKKIVGFFVIVLVIAIITQTKFFSFVLEGLNNEDVSSKTRSYGREYYVSKIIEHPILGCGYINTDNKKAIEYSGLYRLYKSSDRDVINSTIGWVDLGVFGLTFFFGLVGLIWFIVLYFRMTYKAYQISKSGNMLYIMYMIFSIIISPNMTSFLWYIGNAFAFIVWLCLLEKEYKDTMIINRYKQLSVEKKEETFSE